MDEQRQPDIDPAGKRGTYGAEERAEVEGKRIKGLADTDGGPDVEGHLMAGAEGTRGTRITRGTRDVA